MISVEHNGGIGDYVFLRSTDTEVYSQAASQNAGAGAPVPVDTWFCLRFHVVFSAFGAGSLTLTSDVVPSVSLTNVDTRTASPMDFITFGPFFAPNNADVLQPAFDVWVDDVIADDSIAPTCDD